MTKYDSSSIKRYEGLEGVKRRLGMYAGKTSNPNQVVVELVSNAIDEMAAGYGRLCEVIFDKDGSVTIRDYGRGMPFDMHPKYKENTLDILLTKLHAGGKMDDKTSYKTSIGLNGVGIKLATATCKEMIVDVYREGKHARRVASDMKLIGSILIEPNKTNEPNGTKIKYTPIDEEGVWDSTTFDINEIKTVLRGFAYFFPFAHFKLENRIPETPEIVEYNYPDGLMQMYKNMTSGSIIDPIVIKSDLEGIPDALEVVFGYTDSTYDRTVGYCNTLRLSEGGTHIAGFRRALTKSLNDAARALNILKPKDANFRGQELGEGLVAIVSVKLRDPKFENQTKTKLSNVSLEGDTYSKVYEYLKPYFEDNPKVVTIISDKLLRVRKAHALSKKIRDAVLGKSKKEFSSSINSKFSSCSIRDPKRRELILSEGLSANGNIKQARDSTFQALYALRGKVLNVEKKDEASIFDNEELKNLVSLLGCGIKEDYDEKKLQYDKVIIMTDADVDGAHIRLLLLTFFFRFMPDLIKNGHVYTVLGPLFKISYNNKHVYVNSPAERDAVLKKIQGKYNYNVDRYKGLGELNPEDLATTMVDPSSRILLKYSIEDEALVNETFEKLMGSDTAPRKTFLETGEL